jgi:hypothetical protein
MFFNMAKLRLFLLPLALLFSFCKSSQVSSSAPKPGEQYQPVDEPPLISTLTIPVNISLNDIVNTLNVQLSKAALYEDYSYTDNGNDGLMLNAWKSRDITMMMSGNTIKYKVPVKLWMKKDLSITEAEANAEIALAFKTNFYINPDWSLRTETEVEYHEWLSKPVLKTGIGSISVETIANIALNRSKKMLSKTLDDYVSQQINLRPYVEQAWIALQEPVLLDEEYKMWVKTTPLSIAMSPITADWNNIKAKIAVECLNDVSFGDKPSFRQNSSVPNLNLVNDPPDDYQVLVATEVPFSEAERLARNIMVGQEFASGKKKVKVEDIQIWGSNDKLVVNSKLSGSLNGNIYFIGKPTFNPQKNQIEMQDLDFHFETRSFLLRSASWLFQGPIKGQMKKAMNYPLAEDIKAQKAAIQESLTNYIITPGVVLNGTVDSVAVKDIKILPSGIRVNLYSKGRVNVDVKGL